MSNAIHIMGLAFALKRAQQAFRTRVDTMLRPLGLTAPQYAILDAAAADAGISSAALARIAFVTPQTMQGVLSNMIRDGLLVRGAHPLNKRILRTQVTEHGHRTLEEAQVLVDEIEREMIHAVGAANASVFTAMLIKCGDALSSSRPADRTDG